MACFWMRTFTVRRFDEARFQSKDCATLLGDVKKSVMQFLAPLVVVFFFAAARDEDDELRRVLLLDFILAAAAAPVARRRLDSIDAQELDAHILADR